MIHFSYRARNPSGKEVSGHIEAKNVALAQAALISKGLFPVEIQSRTDSKTSLTQKEFSFNLFNQFSSKELASFTKQFEVMFRVGMPISDTLATLAKQAQNPDFKRSLESIQKNVASGSRLGDAFAKHPKYFNELYVSMLEMGQSSGTLDKTLAEMAHILQKEHGIRSRIKSALLYPKIVLLTLLGVTWAMLVFVFPPFKQFYASQGAELPLPTQIIMGMSDIITHYWHLALLVMGGLFLAWREIRKIHSVKLVLGNLAFKVPVFGKLNSMASNARFAHLVASLYRVGLGLPQTLQVVCNTIDNICHREEILKLKSQVESGHSLSNALQKMKYFSPLIKETCAVGEQTGKLDETLDSTGEFYDSEVNDMLANLSTLIEPIMLFILFGAVLLLALAVYMPIWNMSKVVLT